MRAADSGVRGSGAIIRPMISAKGPLWRSGGSMVRRSWPGSSSDASVSWGFFPNAMSAPTADPADVPTITVAVVGSRPIASWRPASTPFSHAIPTDPHRRATSRTA